MALIHQEFTLSTTPTLVADLPTGVHQVAVYITNQDATNVVYVADSAVGNAKGIRVGTQSTLQVWLNANDLLYAVAAAGTPTISVVYSGV